MARAANLRSAVKRNRLAKYPIAEWKDAGPLVGVYGEDWTCETPQQFVVDLHNLAKMLSAKTGVLWKVQTSRAEDAVEDRNTEVWFCFTNTGQPLPRAMEPHNHGELSPADHVHSPGELAGHTGHADDTEKTARRMAGVIPDPDRFCPTPNPGDGKLHEPGKSPFFACETCGTGRPAEEPAEEPAGYVPPPKPNFVEQPPVDWSRVQPAFPTFPVVATPAQEASDFERWQAEQAAKGEGGQE